MLHCSREEMSASVQVLLAGKGLIANYHWQGKGWYSLILCKKFRLPYLGKAAATTKVWQPVLRIFNGHADVMLVTAHGGCTNTVRESALKVGPRTKISCLTRESNLRQYCTWLFCLTLHQPSHIPPQLVYLSPICVKAVTGNTLIRTLHSQPWMNAVFCSLKLEKSSFASEPFM